MKIIRVIGVNAVLGSQFQRGIYIHTPKFHSDGRASPPGRLCLLKRESAAANQSGECIADLERQRFRGGQSPSPGDLDDPLSFRLVEGNRQVNICIGNQSHKYNCTTGNQAVKEFQLSEASCFFRFAMNLGWPLGHRAQRRPLQRHRGQVRQRQLDFEAENVCGLSSVSGQSDCCRRRSAWCGLSPGAERGSDARRATTRADRTVPGRPSRTVQMQGGRRCGC